MTNKLRYTYVDNPLKDAKIEPLASSFSSIHLIWIKIQKKRVLYECVYIYFILHFIFFGKSGEWDAVHRGNRQLIVAEITVVVLKSRGFRVGLL